LLYSFLHELIPFILRCKGSEFHGGGLWARATASKSPPHLQAVLRLGWFTVDYCSAGEQLLVWGGKRLLVSYPDE